MNRMEPKESRVSEDEAYLDVFVNVVIAGLST